MKTFPPSASLHRSLYSIALFTNSIVIWGLVTLAYFQEYDDNYGSIIQGIIIYLFTAVVITLLFFIKRNLVSAHKIKTILFLLFCSPLAVYLAIVVCRE